MRFIPIYRHPSLEAIVSPEDYDYLRCFRWTFSKGYARRWTGGSYIHMAWEVAQRMGLVLPPGGEYDHLDRYPLNNTRENISVSTRSLNNINRSNYTNHLRYMFEQYVTST